MSDVAHRGTRALELGAQNSGERRIYHDASTLGSSHWGRVYLKVQLPVPDAFVHTTFVAFSGTSPKPDMAPLELRVVDTVKESKAGFNNDGNGSRYQFLYNVQPSGRAEFGKGGPYARRFDGDWHCAEWHLDAARQAYHFYFDSAEVAAIGFENGAGNFDKSEIPSVLKTLRVGVNNYQSAPPGFRVWIDDIALDASRPGCF